MKTLAHHPLPRGRLTPALALPLGGLAVCLFSAIILGAQTPTALPPAATPHQGGSSTAGEFAPILDAEKRPITAGGYVKTGTLIYEDISEKSGLTKWHHTMGTPAKQFLLDTTGSGVALLDYDNDGWLDIYLVNGSTYEAMAGKATPPHAALFHNNHDGTFTEVAKQAGVTNDRWGFGVAAADYDNDGWPDLYVTNFGKNRLFHNNHDGTFTDVAEKAGVALGNWSTGPAFGDFDGDGRLDLFVPGYVHYDIAHPPSSGTGAAVMAFCQYRGVAVACGPRGLQGESDHLFHNNGDGTFTDVSKKAGVADANTFYGFTSTFIDVNNDGKVDLLVANDSSSNYLYVNNGDGTFEDISYSSGFALNQSGREAASMGMAVGDYKNNGMVDIYTTSFSDDYDPLFENAGDANFSDITYRTGIAEITYPFLGWGTGFLDFDNDGWKDIFVVNGHMFPQVEGHAWGTTYAERPLLFRNADDGKRFEIIPALEGSGLGKVFTGRGAAFGDLFNDGKIDAVINNMDGTPALLRNRNPDHNHWVGLKLVGGPKSPRDAVGATVFLTFAGTRQRADVTSGGSFMSSNDPRLHFGLGLGRVVGLDAAPGPTDVEVHWPSGLHEKLTLPAVDRYFILKEGEGFAVSADDPAPERAPAQRVRH